MFYFSSGRSNSTVKFESSVAFTFVTMTSHSLLKTEFSKYSCIAWIIVATLIVSVFWPFIFPLKRNLPVKINSACDRRGRLLTPRNLHTQSPSAKFHAIQRERILDLLICNIEESEASERRCVLIANEAEVARSNADSVKVRYHIDLFRLIRDSRDVNIGQRGNLELFTATTNRTAPAT